MYFYCKYNCDLYNIIRQYLIQVLGKSTANTEIPITYTKNKELQRKLWSLGSKVIWSVGQKVS